MTRLAWTATLVLLGGVGAANLQAACPIIPAPKAYHDTGRTLELSPAATAIVVGARATDAEQYAAAQFQTHVQRRFQSRLPIVTEDAIPAQCRHIFAFGQRTTHATLDRLCQARQIDLSATSPGDDGFVIEFVEDADRQVILVGGSNPRGVVYGQNALFDLLRSDDQRLVLPIVSVRDWPSIAWRGRPHWRVRLHLAPGVFDCYARYRLNFTDLRDGPNGIGMFGIPPDFPLDLPVLEQALAQAHRRGMFVYGTVFCGVPPERFDAAIKRFEDLIALGVDGIWISFDDPGPGNRAPEIIRRALECGRRHGMTGRRVANTQPAGSYNIIDTEFNRQTAAIPEYAATKWFFTRVPCRSDLEATRELGLKLLPGWWHNMVAGVPGGFLHNAHIAVGMRTDGKPGYLEMQPLTHGWGAPDYDKIRDADQYTDTVMVWALWDGWPEEYVLGALGIWSWNPAGHDWNATRRAVYRDVYGPRQVDLAMDVDDKHVALKSLFHMPERRYEPNKGWPCRLRRVEDRSKALALIDELESLHARLRAQAPAETLLDPGRLEATYLEPLQATLTYARRTATLDYPEYSLPDFESKMISLVDAGQSDEAAALVASVRQQVNTQLTRIEAELGDLKGIDTYTEFWRQQVSSPDVWQARVQQRRGQMQQFYQQLVADGFAPVLVDARLEDKDYADLFALLPSPPAGPVVAELAADQWLAAPPRWQGRWAIGPLAWQGRTLSAIAFPRHTASKVGDYAELRTTVQTPAFQGRLLLDLFVQDTKFDLQYTKYRFMELWVGDTRIWQEDASDSRDGHEWLSLDITKLATPGQPLALRFRVEDRRPVGCYGTATFLGPLRLRTTD